ncbi:MAG: 30S ribosomal protein S21 [Firmicutes bacterium]|nr:30S ribosomal protein S21 [Bacillota bacterium]
MTKVVVNGDIDFAIKKFKNKVAKSGVPSELRKKKYYEKPGIVRRHKVEEGIKNSRKKNRSA